MGKLILTVEGTTVGTVATGGGVVIERAVSEQDSARLIMAFAKILGERFTDAEGNPRQPGMVEVIEAWFDDVIAQSNHRVRVQEQKVAMAAAAASVPPIAVAS